MSSKPISFGEAFGRIPAQTCKNEWEEYNKFRCSVCWFQVDAISTNTTQQMPIRYCPHCGRRVER